MSRYLSKLGFHAVIGKSGAEGIRLAKKLQPLLITLDVMMPQMDGPSLIRALKELKSEVKSIIITGLGEENKIGEARSAGADAILNKPFTAEQLLTSMKQLL